MLGVANTFQDIGWHNFCEIETGFLIFRVQGPKFFLFTDKSFSDGRGLIPPTAQLGWLGRRLSRSAQGAEPAGSKSSAPPATRKARVEDLNRRSVGAHRHDLHVPQ